MTRESHADTTVRITRRGPGLPSLAAPVSAPAPAPVLPPAPSQSVALSVRFLAQNAFKNPSGMCGTLRITNPSQLTCRTWTVTAAPDVRVRFHVDLGGTRRSPRALVLKAVPNAIALRAPISAEAYLGYGAGRL